MSKKKDKKSWIEFKNNKELQEEQRMANDNLLAIAEVNKKKEMEEEK